MEEVTNLAPTPEQRLSSFVPTSFLILLAINIVFLGLTFWVFNNQMELRTQVIIDFIDKATGSVIGRNGEVDALVSRLDALEHDVRVLEVKERQSNK